MINITLPDGSVKQVAKGSTALDIARQISEGLARNVLAAKVNGKVINATSPLSGDATLQLLTWNDQEENPPCGTPRHTLWPKPSRCFILV